MKKNKKSLLIITLFLTFIFLIPCVYADDSYNAKISTSNANPNIGDEFTVNIDWSSSIATECNVKLDYDTSKISMQSAVGAGSYSPSSQSFSINKASASIDVKFRADNAGGTDVKIGSVKCENADLKGNSPSTNINVKSVNLSSLTLTSAKLSPEFNPGVMEYTAILTSEKTKISAGADNMKVEGAGEYTLAIDEQKDVNITVSNSNGVKTTYKIKLTRPASENKSDNKNLAYISFNGKKIDFNKDTITYKIDAKYSVVNADIKFKTEDEKAKAVLSGPNKLEVGDNTYKITVTAEDGSTKEYTLTITRAKEKNTVDYDETKILEELEKGTDNNIYVTVNQKEKIKTVDKSIIKSLKDTKKSITYEVVDDKENILYSFTLDGKNIKDTTKMLNFTLTFKSDNKSVIDKLANNKKLVYLNFANNTTLPGKISVKVKVNNTFKNNSKLYLYYFNEKEEKLEKVGKALTVKNGYVEFDLDHTSEYVLSDTDFDAKTTATNEDNVLKAVIIAGSGVVTMLIVLVIYLIIRKKKKGNNPEKKKEKKSKKNKNEEVVEETNVIEDSSELENTKVLDIPNNNETNTQDVEEQNTTENNESVENTETPINDTQPSNEEQPETKEEPQEEIEVLDLEEPKN